MDGMCFTPSQGDSTLFGSAAPSELNGNSTEFVPNLDTNNVYGTAPADPSFLPTYTDPMATQLFPPVGSTWPYTLNLVLRPENPGMDVYR